MGVQLLMRMLKEYIHFSLFLDEKPEQHRANPFE